MRYAGDYFGVSIAEPENRDSSKLLSYFPALRSTYGKPNIGKDNPDQIKKPGTGTAFGGSKPGEF